MANIDTTISHVRQSDGSIQANCDHMKNVAYLAKKFSEQIGLGEWGRVMGLLHDIGKEKHAFQQHIKKVSGIDPSATIEGDYSHAYVGALIARDLFPHFAHLLINPLAGHHRGLYDFGDLELVMKKSMPKEIVTERISAQFEKPKGLQPKDLHHLQRLLFSCLVDADYLDTEAFMLPEQSRNRKGTFDMSDLFLKLTSHLKKINNESPDTEVNRIRQEVQKACLEAADNHTGFYSLTVPTGGGKTLSSVAWALKHCISNSLNRIVIAIPYTSIITQTAAVLKSVFGEDNVLEHHSEIGLDDKEYSEIALQHKLATENWDYPIIVTTNVQLFESLFSNKPSSCRKLHNLTNSVLILDEIQTLPTHFLRPIVDTLDTLHRLYHASVLFTTASQPVLSGKIVGCNQLNSFDALPYVKEIIPKDTNLHLRLRRTSIEFDATPCDYDVIAQRIATHTKVLCIVNTRRDAKEIFDRLPNEGLRFHLSRMMCPAHLRESISNLKQLLKSNDEIPIRVVATQLIEAGVDIDFPVVYRQEAGLDSILQAAGRCNREGRLSIGTTHVFSFNRPLPPGHITQTNNARIALGHQNDWFAPETMNAYFHQLYSRVDDFDSPKVKDLLYTSEMQFETAAKAFQLIDDNTIPIIVNWQNSLDLAERIKNKPPSYQLLKQIHQYCVNIRQHDFKKLLNTGALEEIIEGLYLLPDSSFYNERTGLTIENHWLEETIIL